MTDEQLEPTRRRRRREHPIIAGVIALVAVAAVIGAVVAGGALAATKGLGLGDEEAVDTGATNSATLYLPDPTETESSPESSITLPAQPSSSGGSKPDKPKKPEKPEPSISLSAGQTAVAPMQQIDLTGVYPDGEGAILRVQRFENGSWANFPVTASVSGGSFSTYIQTGAAGVNRFRMIDTDNGQASNEVKVRIS